MVTPDFSSSHCIKATLCFPVPAAPVPPQGLDSHFSEKTDGSATVQTSEITAVLGTWNCHISSV